MSRFHGRVRFCGIAEVIALPRECWRELERLSLEGDSETQAALAWFLDQRGHRVARVRSFNLTTTAGLNYAGSTLFPNGSWFIMQKGAGSVNAADTMSSHGAWSELTTYTQATRPALTLDSWTAGVATSSAAPAIYTAPTGGLTFHGWGLTTGSAKGGTTGTLYAAADHSSPQVIAAGSALRQTLTGTAS